MQKVSIQPFPDGDIAADDSIWSDDQFQFFCTFSWVQFRSERYNRWLDSFLQHWRFLWFIARWLDSTTLSSNCAALCWHVILAKLSWYPEFCLKNKSQVWELKEARHSYRKRQIVKKCLERQRARQRQRGQWIALKMAIIRNCNNLCVKGFTWSRNYFPKFFKTNYSKLLSYHFENKKVKVMKKRLCA